MDASASSDSMTDGEDNHSEASPSPAATTQVSVADESPGVTVVQLSDGETVQVQGVIQAPQTSVIQSPQVQPVQIATVAELEGDESATDTQKRREILSRRPSYRKILNELSFDSPAVPKIDEEKTEEEAPASSTAVSSVLSSVYQTSSGQYIAIAQGKAIQLTSPGVEALQGAQTLTVGSSPTPQAGATILQYATQPGNSPQQFYIQGGQVLFQEPWVLGATVLILPLKLLGEVDRISSQKDVSTVLRSHLQV
ncbi:cAMP-responsive element modulator isoform X2 [Channa argus]|uniref:cAMP-responsive element modulator isoform X2 n=1 Tax=Channa argus TaxID=215402 RepID=UPI0035201C32